MIDFYTTISQKVYTTDLASKSQPFVRAKRIPIFLNFSPPSASGPLARFSARPYCFCCDSNVYFAASTFWALSLGASTSTVYCYYFQQREIKIDAVLSPRYRPLRQAKSLVQEFMYSSPEAFFPPALLEIGTHCRIFSMTLIAASTTMCDELCCWWTTTPCILVESFPSCRLLQGHNKQ